MKNYFLAAIIGLVVLTLSAPVSWAWEKDSGASCERVFASIQNDGVSRNWNGVVNANGVDVVNTSGLDASNNFVTVEWIPTSGFFGSVEATVTLSNAGDSKGDYSTIKRDLDCRESNPTPTLSPTPTQEVTPTPTVTPVPSTNTGGPGDGKSDGRSDGLSSCPSCTQAPSGPIKAVLGLSTTSGEENSLLQFVQLFGALGAAGLGFILFKKNA